MKILWAGSRIGNQENTRCLGNYLVKGGYKEFDELACAISEPVIADPEINGGIFLDENSRWCFYAHIHFWEG
jgi:TAK1-binding protein 1